jgi:fructan beta-fructosidase
MFYGQKVKTHPNFRDPYVFFYAPTNSWIMSVALPRAHQVLIYRSTDLIHWGPLPVSTFGPSGVDGFQWETPNLFQVPVQGTNQKKWVPDGWHQSRCPAWRQH